MFKPTENIPWKRFWSPLGESISCDDDGKGFLFDPESDFWRPINPNVSEIGQLLDRQCLILLGEPGMGKSNTLRSARGEIESKFGEGRPAPWIEFRDIPDTGTFIRRTIETSAWKDWVSGTHKLTLVIDGLDEGLIKIPDFISFLRAELQTADVNRLQLILACRFADWPEQAGKELQNLWPKDKTPQKFDLCPLRRKDVLLAAEEYRQDESAFMQAIHDAHVTGLANRPVTLLMLIGEFARAGKLPGTHRELYQAGCKTLCREVDQGRVEGLRQLYLAQPRPSNSQKFRVACRLASLLMLSGKSAIYTGELSQASAIDLTFPNILKGRESVDGVSFAMSDLHIWETLATALFSSRGEYRIGFAHQTFMEALAAAYLKNLPLIQINQLLCQSDGFELHVVPQLTELSAWVAVEHPEFCDQLIAHEPEVLLRSDVSLLSVERKERLVDRLLKRAQNEETFDDYGAERFYAGLSHPCLSVQLEAVIFNRSYNYIARRMAVRVAGACRLTDLTSPLLQLIADPAEDASLKKFTAEALETITPVERLADLLPLVRGEVTEDPHDDIKASALKAMIPRYLSVGEAAPYLTARKHRKHIGGYRMLLGYQLPKLIQPNDIVPLLGMIANHPGNFNYASWLREICDKTFCDALARLDEPEMATAFVKAWVCLIRAHDELPLDKNFQFHGLLLSNDAKRLQVIRLLLDSPLSTQDDMGWLIPTKITSPADDLPWFIEGLERAEEAHRTKWINGIYHIASNEIIAKHWDFFLAAMSRIPLLRDFYANLFRAWNLDEPMARKAKAEWLRRDRFSKKHGLMPGPPLDQQIQECFDLANSGKSLEWVHLCDLLFREGEEQYYWGTNFEILESPGWLKASDERKSQIKQLGRRFLLECRDERVDGAITYNTWAGYKAILLLANDVLAEDSLRAAVKDKWLDALLDGPVENGSFPKALVVIQQLEPQILAQGLRRAYAKDKTNHCFMTWMRVTEPYWNDHLSQVIEEVLLANPQPEMIYNIFERLVAIDKPCGLRCFNRLWASIQSSSEDPLKAPLIGVGLIEMPQEAWPKVKSQLWANDELAKMVFLQVADIRATKQEGIVLTPSASETNDLYIRMRQLFPVAEDPPSEGVILARGAVARLRDRQLGILTSMGTKEACHELLRLGDVFPEDRLYLNWRYRECLSTYRKQLWRPQDPETVLEMTSDHTRRLVLSENDLMEVVLESLHRFQKQLVASKNPQAGDLWNYEGAGTQRRRFSPKDEEDLSGKIAAWLQNDLRPTQGIILNREVQLQRGQRTDVLVEATTPEGSGSSTLSLVIEVKGCWNRDIPTAVENQLIDLYLKPHGLTHGIFLVGWYICPKWDSPTRPASNALHASTFSEAQVEIEQMVSHYQVSKSPWRIQGCILDCRIT